VRLVVYIIRVIANVLPLYGQREGYRAFGGQGVATREMEILLEVGWFDMDGGVEMSLTQVHIYSR
jgi:hypothetical protein